MTFVMRVDLEGSGDGLIVRWPDSDVPMMPLGQAGQLFDREASLSRSAQLAADVDGCDNTPAPSVDDCEEFGFRVHSELLTPLLRNVSGPERVFVRCLDATASRAPLEAAIEPQTGRLVSATDRRPSIVRYFGELLDQPLPAGSGLRVLHLDATGLNQFAPTELALIEQHVDSVGGAFKAERVTSPAGAYAALRSFGPGVLVLAAHGHDGGARVQLGDDEYEHRIATSEFAAEIGRLRPVPPIVILAVCGGADPAAGGGLAKELLDHGVGAVIAARHEVDATAMSEFTNGFMVALANGDPIDECVRNGRRWMVAGGPTRIHTGVLALFTRHRDLTTGFEVGRTRMLALFEQLSRNVATISASIPLMPIEPVPVTPSIASLLRPETRVVPFIGRTDELNTLEEWRDRADDGVSVAIIAGEGGTGKTRLGIEFVDRSLIQGWTAGFLSPRWGDMEPEQLAAGTTDRVLVIDYAEANRNAVTALLDAALAQPTGGGRLRLLLLVRQRPMGVLRDWQSIFRSAQSSSGRLDEILDLSPVIELTARMLTDGERADLTTVAATAFADRLSAAGHDPTPRPFDLDGTSDRDEPLTHLADVLLRVLGENEIDDALAGVLRHEHRYWQRTLPDDSSVMIDQVVTVTVLAGLPPINRLAELLTVVPDLADAPARERNRLAEWCHQLAIGNSLLQPDRLAERHAIATLDHSPGLLDDLLSRVETEELTQLVRVLSRAAKHHGLSSDTESAVIAQLPSWSGRSILQPQLLFPLISLIAQLSESGGRQVSRAVVSETLTAAVGVKTAETDASTVAAFAALIEVSRKLLGDDHPDTRLAVENLADYLWDTRRYADSLELYGQNVESYRGSLGDHHPDTVRLVHDYAARLYEVARFSEALPLVGEVLEDHRSSYGDHALESLKALNDVANCLLGLGRAAEALPLYEECLSGCSTALGEKHPQTLWAVNNLASCLMELGRVGEALPLFEGNLASCRAAMGNEHPITLFGASFLAECLHKSGRYDDSLPLYEECFAGRRGVLGENHRDTLKAMMDLANCLLMLGRADEALPLLEENLDSRRKVMGGDHPDTLQAVNTLAKCLFELGRAERALRLSEMDLEARCRVLGDDHPWTLSSVIRLAGYRYRMGQSQDALPLFEEALEGRCRLLGDDHPDTLSALNGLASCLHEVGRSKEALPLFERCLSVRLRVSGDDDPATLRQMNNLGSCLRAAGRPGDALAMFERIVAVPAHPQDLGFVNNYALCLDELGRANEALSVVANALEVAARQEGPTAPEVRQMERLKSYLETQVASG